jgi:hypothetical protein
MPPPMRFTIRRPATIHGYRLRRQRLGRMRLVRREQLIGERVAAKIVRVRVAALAQTLKLRASFRNQPILLSFVAHR